MSAPESLEDVLPDILTNEPIRTGSTTSTATKPLNKIDKTGVYQGTGYDGAGNPIYKKVANPEKLDGTPLLHAPKDMKVSERGLDLIKEHEGYSGTVYKDSAGLLTIGYGHLIKAGESYTNIDEAKASELLAQDSITAQNAVRKCVKQPLTQNQFDALMSFAYNIGAGAFCKSTAVKRLNQGDSAGVPEAMMRFNKITENKEKIVNGKKIAVPTKVVSKGLNNRRQKEVALFTQFSPSAVGVVAIADEADEEDVSTLLG